MGQVKSDIQKLIKEQGSLSAARSFSKNWFEKVETQLMKKVPVLLLKDSFLESYMFSDILPFLKHFLGTIKIQ